VGACLGALGVGPQQRRPEGACLGALGVGPQRIDDERGEDYSML
jgi:hypothetical protein